jgi:rhodanese-related sulfurtransferase
MISKATAFVVMALAAQALSATSAASHDLGIYQATLAEANQKSRDISTEQMRRILVDGSAVVIDARPRPQFDAGHLPGALPLDAPSDAQVAAVEHLVSGDKTKALVLYCNGPYCQASRRLADRLLSAGFTNVRRYQLGIPVWRALGGPIEIEIGGILRVFNKDRTAVFIDARAAGAFAKGSISGARNMPLDDLASGKLKKFPLPEDDFNRRIVLFGQNGKQARRLAEILGKKPWHNVAYFPGSFETLAAALRGNQ